MPSSSKQTAVFLVLSLVANVALSIALLLRPGAITSAPLPTRSTTSDKNSSQLARSSKAIIDALGSGNAEAMRAAGVPLDVIHRLAAARAYVRVRDLERRRQGPPPNEGKSYWRSTPLNPGGPKPPSEEDAEGKQAEEEFKDAMQAAFGDGDLFGGDDSSGRYAFLPAATRDRVRRIEKDYDELREQISRDINGVQLPSDEAKFKLLWDEQKRDVYATMSPEERTQFDLHVSGAAETVRFRWGDVIQTEADYQKIFALQKVFSDRFPADAYADGPPAAETLRAREMANRQLEDDVRAIVGEQNYADFQRANDDSHRMLTALATRLALPAGTVNDVYDLRAVYATRSLQINDDASLSADQRREQITALAAQANADLAAKLGKEGAEAIVKSSTVNWLATLKSGSAFSTSRRDAPETSFSGDRSLPVYTVPPPAKDE